MSDTSHRDSNCCSTYSHFRSSSDPGQCPRAFVTRSSRSRHGRGNGAHDLDMATVTELTISTWPEVTVPDDRRCCSSCCGCSDALLLLVLLSMCCCSFFSMSPGRPRPDERASEAPRHAVSAVRSTRSTGDHLSSESWLSRRSWCTARRVCALFAFLFTMRGTRGRFYECQCRSCFGFFG